MGLTVQLQGESGDVVGEVIDSENLLHQVLRSSTNGQSCCLRYIDWYGETIFNRLQMTPFLSEWARTHSGPRTEQEIQLINGVESLALRCREEPHLYLCFIGD